MKIMLLAAALFFVVASAWSAPSPSPAELDEALKLCAAGLKKEMAKGNNRFVVRYKMANGQHVVIPCVYNPNLRPRDAQKKPEPPKLESSRPATFRPVQSPQSGRVHVCYKGARRIVTDQPCDRVK